MPAAAADLPLPAVLAPNVDMGKSLVILNWCLFGVATVCVLGRAYSKAFKLKRFALDDGLMLACWVRYTLFPHSITILRMSD